MNDQQRARELKTKFPERRKFTFCRCYYDNKDEEEAKNGAGEEIFHELWRQIPVRSKSIHIKKEGKCLQFMSQNKSLHSHYQNLIHTHMHILFMSDKPIDSNCERTQLNGHNK